jgi:dTDP-4-dehydrorhamnose 3,5-epimerase
MALKIRKTALPDVLVFEPAVHADQRGFFMEIFNRTSYAAAGLERTFIQDNYSCSIRGILRGLHYQLHHPQGKFVYVIRGEVFDVAVDIRAGSPTFGQWVGEVLSEHNRRQMFIPEGFAHGFCVLSETVDFMYKCTEVYHPEDDRGINWADAQLNIRWPIENPQLSEKDTRLPCLKDLPRELLPAYTAFPA